MFDHPNPDAEPVQAAGAAYSPTIPDDAIAWDDSRGVYILREPTPPAFDPRPFSAKLLAIFRSVRRRPRALQLGRSS